MSVPGGIRAKLAFWLILVVGAALGAAYLMIVPSLEQRLVEEKLDLLESRVAARVPGPPRDTTLWPGYVNTASALTDSRVAIVQLLSENPARLSVLEDSRLQASTDLVRDPLALEAATGGQAERGRVDRRGSSYAELALPAGDYVVLFSASLEDSLATVRVVKRRLLYAAGAALGIAGLLGIVAASVLARRIRRLERAAERIAQGAFDEPVVDLGDDEIGQLAEAFDRMRRQLAQLDTARRAFVANASHELRTPLFSLAGFLELLSDEELDEETRRSFLRTTREQVERLTALATDLLDLSRMDAGRFHVEEEEVDVAEAVQTVAEELRALAETSGHALVATESEPVWAVADEERVIQIGRALARNALVHTPAGTRVELRAEQAGDRVLVTVADDGPGIPADHLEHIFDRFFRVDGSQASGSGLGLAIARELAQRMGGAVEVESGPGRTTFTLTLPGAPVPEAASALVEA
jgi:signal transduction histidine kinase